MAIELTFLGTSQAVPTASRNHTAVLLRYQDEMILIDCGEGTQRQFRKARINPCKLTRILITHWHGDHILGLPGLLQTLVLNNYNKTLQIYGPPGTQRFLETLLKMFIFVGDIKIKIQEVREGIFYANNNFILEAHNLEHTCPCLGYIFKETDKRKINLVAVKKLGLKPGPELGKLQSGQSINHEGRLIKPEEVSFVKQGKKIAFVFDTAICKSCEKTAKDADLLICEATYLNELKDKAAEYKHMTSVQAATLAKKSKVKKLFLTHISQRYEHESEKILKEAKKIFKNSFLAEDLMKVEL